MPLAMNLADFIIIYLAFGAPLAVYKFLQSRDVEMRRRIAISIFRLLFWIPAAVRLMHHSITNAYSKGRFVSKENLDSSDVRLAELREKVRTELAQPDRRLFTAHEVREVLDRYIGLTRAADASIPQVIDASLDLFEAAGRPDDKLAAICLMRRNRRQIERHHIKARRSFLTLFERSVTEDAARAQRAVQLGLELASQLDDQKAVDGLIAIAAIARDEVWNPEGQQRILSNVSTPVSPLSMKTAPFNND